MEYLRLTRSTNENNPYISQLKEKILLSRENILQTITNMKEGSMLRRENIVEKNKEIDLIINNVPTLEREYIEVAREQEIKRNLYLFLLQKREETQLAMSSATDSGKIIDYAYTAEAPVAPNKKIIIAIALFLSILLSLIYIYIESLFNKKIKKQKEIERLTQTPIIGSIPYNNIEENNQNIFRNLRSNLLLFNKDREEAKIILITSSSQQEGKSLIAINLAQSFAKSNKKTILIDLNTQNPIIAQKLQLDNTIGIKDYLLKENINENNIIQHSNYDVITLGNINNNESIDLLSNNKLKCLFDYLRKEYDQIIIDTLSLQESTDILLLNDIVDTILYVCLKNKTTRKDIKNLNNLLAKNLLNNVLIVYNENKNS